MSNIQPWYCPKTSCFLAWVDPPAKSLTACWSKGNMRGIQKVKKSEDPTQRAVAVGVGYFFGALLWAPEDHPLEGPPDFSPPSLVAFSEAPQITTPSCGPGMRSDRSIGSVPNRIFGRQFVGRWSPACFLFLFFLWGGWWSKFCFNYYLYIMLWGGWFKGLCPKEGGPRGVVQGGEGGFPKFPRKILNMLGPGEP